MLSVVFDSLNYKLKLFNTFAIAEEKRLMIRPWPMMQALLHFLNQSSLSFAPWSSITIEDVLRKKRGTTTFVAV